MMLQDQLGSGEGQLKVKEEGLKRVEKQLEAQASGGICEPAGRCVENQTGHSGEKLPRRGVCSEEALHREAGHQRAGLQKATLLQKRTEAPKRAP